MALPRVVPVPGRARRGSAAPAGAQGVLPALHHLLPAWLAPGDPRNPCWLFGGSPRGCWCGDALSTPGAFLGGEKENFLPKKKKIKKHSQPGSSLLPWGLWGSPHRELCPLSWIVLGAWASAWSGEGLGMLFLMSFPSISAVPCSAFPSLCSSKVRIPRANPRKEKSPFFPPSLSSEQRRAGIVPRA